MPVITELLARLGVDSRDFDSKLRDAERKLKRQAGAVDSISKKLSVGVSAIVAGVGVRAIVRTSDAYTVLQNRLRAVTDSQEELARVQERLFQVSRDTRSSVEANVELFSRLSLSTKELGVSESELIDFTKSLNQAIKLSGATATEAQAGIIQLAQGMASGALRGDELRSVLEQLPAVADVIAKSLGVTRGQLREMGSQGQITAEVILKAFRASREELDERFKETLATIAEGFAVLRNELIPFIGELVKATGLGETLGEALETIAKGVRKLADEIKNSGVIRLLERLTTLGGQQRVDVLAGAREEVLMRQLEALRRKPAGTGTTAAQPQLSAAPTPEFVGPLLPPADAFAPLLAGLQELGSQAETVFSSIGSLTQETFRVVNETIDAVVVTNSEKWAAFYRDIEEKQLAFRESVSESWSTWIAQASDITSQTKLLFLDVFQSIAAGLGDAVAQIVVFKQDAEEVFKQLMKNILANVISTLTQIVIEWALATIAQAVIGTAGHVQRVGQALQMVFLNTWASISAIPVVGPVLAPEAAAGATAAAAAASVAVAAAGQSIGAAGSLPLGLATGGLVSSEGLAFLHAGEVVATPDEVKDAMSGDRDGFTFNLLLDGRLVARSILPHIPREIRMRGV